MSHAKLISNVSDATGVPKAAVRKVITQIPKTIAAMVRDGYRVNWFGLGVFGRKHYAGRVINGQEVPDMLIATFKLSKSYKELVKRVLVDGVEVIRVEPQSENQQSEASNDETI